MFGLVRKSRLTEAQEEIDELRGKLGEVRQNHDDVKCAYSNLIGVLPSLPSKHGEVSRLEKPHVAYKATAKGIATLVVPEGARVVYPTVEAQRRELFRYDKLRTDRVEVICIEDARESGSNLYKDDSIGSNQFTYREGATETPNGDHLNEDITRVCTTGIHLFRERAHAEAWYESYGLGY